MIIEQVKQRVHQILKRIEKKWAVARWKETCSRDEWILKACEDELMDLMNMHITPQWLKDNGFVSFWAVRKALTAYKPIAWEQRWYHREQ